MKIFSDQSVVTGEFLLSKEKFLSCPPFYSFYSKRLSPREKKKSQDLIHLRGHFVTVGTENCLHLSWISFVGGWTENS